MNWRRYLDTDARSMISGTMVVFALRGAGAVLAFGLNVAVGRTLGVAGAGAYFTALALVTNLSIIARLGLDHAIIKVMAGYLARDDRGRARAVARLSMLWVTAAGGILGLGLVLAAPTLAGAVFRVPELTGLLYAMAAGIVSFSVMVLWGSAFQALQHLRSAMILNGVLYPLVGLALIWPLTQLFGVTGAGIAYLVSTTVAALAGVLAWRWQSGATKGHGAGTVQDEGHGSNHDSGHQLGHDLGPVAGTQRTATPEVAQDVAQDVAPKATPDATADVTADVGPELWASARALWPMNILAQGLLPTAPLLLLTLWGTAEEAGLFGVASRVAVLVTFFLMSVGTVMAARFTALHVTGDRAGLIRAVRRGNLLILVATSPVILPLLVAPGLVLSVFGAGFAAGGPALVILALGQAVNAATGTVGLVLIMTGHERDARRATVLGTVAVGVLGVGLIPPFGLIGAAVASAAAVAVVNLMSLWFVWERLGFLALPRVPGFGRRG